MITKKCNAKGQWHQENLLLVQIRLTTQ